jgi:hypothetical protein
MFKILGQRQQDILQCLWDAKQINGDTPEYVKWENSRHLRNSKEECMELKIRELNELETKNAKFGAITHVYRRINELRRVPSP